MKMHTILSCALLTLSPFLNAEEGYFSQASQDRFAHTILYSILGKQDPGYYLEIGAGEPININNSYFFEKNLDWSGVSIDISEALSPSWHEARHNPLLIADATQANYREILAPFPRVIDYLSLDVDDHYTDVLRQLPFDTYLFKVITIEHDFYRYGELHRRQERQFLAQMGYELLCANVSHHGFSFEDWWIHPSFFTKSQLSILASLDLDDKDHSVLIDTLRALVTPQ